MIRRVCQRRYPWRVGSILLVAPAHEVVILQAVDGLPASGKAVRRMQSVTQCINLHLGVGARRCLPDGAANTVAEAIAQRRVKAQPARRWLNSIGPVGIP